MKTRIELEKDIISITTKIYQVYPELSKYISEMPVKVSGIYTKNLKDYYNSLEELLIEYSKTHEEKQGKQGKDPQDSGYPIYPSEEDIYKQDKKVVPENTDISLNRAPNNFKTTWNEKSFEDDMSGDDLDVPGSELDDQQESLGSEDEENNYYSLGGDNHKDLEEDNG